MIEEYVFEGEGYNPFLIRPGFQVAKLNYCKFHGLDDIVDVEVHNDTDEVFILLEGVGILVETENPGDAKLKCVKMKKGIVYNVPKGVWHNIAMSKDAEIIIVEKNNTHLNDVAHFELDETQLRDVYDSIRLLCRQS